MINVRENQSILDLAAQNYGDVRAVIEMMRKNNVSLTDEFNSGDTLLSVDETIYKDPEVLDYFAAKKKVLTTGQPLAQLESLGIGTMIIQTNFDVF